MEAAHRAHSLIFLLGLPLLLLGVHWHQQSLELTGVLCFVVGLTGSFLLSVYENHQSIVRGKEESHQRLMQRKDEELSRCKRLLKEKEEEIYKHRSHSFTERLSLLTAEGIRESCLAFRRECLEALPGFLDYAGTMVPHFWNAIRYLPGSPIPPPLPPPFLTGDVPTSAQQPMVAIDTLLSWMETADIGVKSREENRKI